MVCHPDRQHAAQRFQAWNADRNLGFHTVGRGVDHGDGIVIGIGDEDLPGRGHDARRAASAVAVFPEGNSRANEGFHLGRGGSGNVHHAHRIRLEHIRIAQAGDHYRAACGLALDARGGLRAGESEGWERQASSPRLSRIGSGDGPVFEHAEVSDVELAPVGRKRQRKGQPANPHRRQHLPRPGVDRHHAKIRLVHGVEDIALGVERQVAGVAVVKAALVEVDHAAPLGRPIEPTDASGIAFRGEHRVLPGKGQSHEYAAPVSGVKLVQRIDGAGHQVAHFPAAPLTALHHRQGIPARPSVGGDHRPARGAHDQPKRARAGRVLLSQGRNNSPTR